jgi:hypothetical protein
MSYNRVNILRRIVEIQEITLRHTRRGVSQEWVYVHEIYPRFLISRATYYDYLATPAKMELRRLEEAGRAQLRLDFE